MRCLLTFDRYECDEWGQLEMASLYDCLRGNTGYSREAPLLYKQWEEQTRNASISTGSSGLLIPTGQVTCTHTRRRLPAPLQRGHGAVSAPCRRCGHVVLLELADTLVTRNLSSRVHPYYLPDRPLGKFEAMLTPSTFESYDSHVCHRSRHISLPMLLCRGA
jgi:hypothetical protein